MVPATCQQHTFTCRAAEGKEGRSEQNEESIVRTQSKKKKKVHFLSLINFGLCIHQKSQEGTAKQGIGLH